MATANATSRISVSRLALTGAIASCLFFVLCWLGAHLRLGTLSHMYIELFTKAPVNSPAALAEGARRAVAPQNPGNLAGFFVMKPSMTVHPARPPGAERPDLGAS